MSEEKILNKRIRKHVEIPTPTEVQEELPLTDESIQTVHTGRKTIQEILKGNDPRPFIVIGPCSIHDVEAARDYANRLRELADQVADTLFIVMRAYFEKPRTSVGWKGLINDPYLDDSFCIQDGIKIARKLLLEINSMGLPVGTEALDPISPQFLDGLVSWTAIGARTVESQTHREMASGLSTPIGFKNGTDGNLSTMVNAIKAAAQPHHFLGISGGGKCSVFETTGNSFTHAVLRGGAQPNYDSVNIALCERALEEAGLYNNIMVDCSHGNSRKDHELQPLVFSDCIKQILEGNTSIKGVMIESNIGAGNQAMTTDVKELQYGVSVTDACIDWETTRDVLLSAREQLGPIIDKRRAA